MWFNLFFIFYAGKSIWELVAEQFEDLLVRILLLAACISFVSLITLHKEQLFCFEVSKTDHLFEECIKSALLNLLYQICLY